MLLYWAHMHRMPAEPPMPEQDRLTSLDCNCRAVRQAARTITQFYDRYLAPSGLRISQFGVLAILASKEPLTINELAAEFIIDRTTLGRNILPLQRDGFIRVKPSPFDRRSKKRFHEARKYWLEAQKGFEARFGGSRAAELRGLLHAVVDSDIRPAAATLD